MNPLRACRHSATMGVSEGGGAPFTAHLFTSKKGLEYPPQLTYIPSIYEGSEFFSRENFLSAPPDIHLFKLEDMMMIDMDHAWYHGTRSDFKYYLRRLVTFSEKYSVPTLLNTPLLLYSFTPSSSKPSDTNHMDSIRLYFTTSQSHQKQHHL
jgi:hypothetical protein